MFRRRRSLVLCRIVLKPRRAGILLSLPALLAIETFSLRLLMCRIRIGVDKKGGTRMSAVVGPWLRRCVVSLCLSLFFSFVSFFFPGGKMCADLPLRPCLRKTLYLDWSISGRRMTARRLSRSEYSISATCIRWCRSFMEAHTSNMKSTTISSAFTVRGRGTSPYVTVRHIVYSLSLSAK